MPYLIGTDEAGYGPNLGPLVVSATVWEVPEGVGGDDLYRLLGEAIVATRRQAGANRLAIADSKKLYQPGTGLGHLERAVLAALAVLRKRPRSWGEMFEAVAPESTDPRKRLPWYADYDEAVPVDSDPDEIEPLGRLLGSAMADAGVGLVGLHSRVVLPEEFNRRVEQDGSKGAVLSHATLDLVADGMEGLEGAPVLVVCDKHGGRNRYADLLAHHFPGPLIEIHGESRRRSTYRFGPPEGRVEIRFQAGGESELPAALASMVSKYLRELAMRALNAFWCRRVAGLRPTAGYPGDARRFKAAIAEVQAELGIEDGVLWRSR